MEVTQKLWFLYDRFHRFSFEIIIENVYCKIGIFGILHQKFYAHVNIIRGDAC